MSGDGARTYDPEVHHFRNLSCAEVVADLDVLIGGLLQVNPKLKMILTVSPVQLVATRTDRNVLIASSYSKSVLRAAAGEIEVRYDHVAYFPSYEIVSHPASFGQYLASDLREVTERGVAHVMNCFLSSFYGLEPQAGPAADAVAAAPVVAPQVDEPLAECDELFNARP